MFNERFEYEDEETHILKLEEEEEDKKTARKIVLYFACASTWLEVQQIWACRNVALSL